MDRLSPAPHFSSKETHSCSESLWFTCCRGTSPVFRGVGERAPQLPRAWSVMPPPRNLASPVPPPSWDSAPELAWLCVAPPVLASPRVSCAVFLGLRLVSQAIWTRPPRLLFSPCFHLPFLSFYFLVGFFNFMFQSSCR